MLVSAALVSAALPKFSYRLISQTISFVAILLVALAIAGTTPKLAFAFDERVNQPYAAFVTYIDSTFGALMIVLSLLCSVVLAIVAIVKKRKKFWDRAIVLLLIAVVIFLLRTLLYVLSDEKLLI